MWFFEFMHTHTSAHGRSQLKHQNLREGGCMWRWCLNASTILMQVPTPDTKKLAARDYQIDLHRALSRPARQWRKLYCVDLPIAQLPSFCNFRTQLCATSDECCERGYRQVCVELRCQMSWHQTHIKMIAATFVGSVDLLFDYLCSYLEHLKKTTQNCQN